MTALTPHWFLILAMLLPGHGQLWQTFYIPVPDAKSCALEQRAVEQTKAPGEETASICTFVDDEVGTSYRLHWFK